ncbi:MAG: hypothetical protein EOM35_07070 [Negativicutes bacterium]|nr:hypothetical protein [Negativicutes bacterium]
MFGQYMCQGGYPISRAYWHVALFRSALKDYIYVGKVKHNNDSKVEVHGFKKLNSTKSTYLIYYNDSTNNGVVDAQFEVPIHNNVVTLKTVYTPKLTNPLDISNTVGTDQIRSGLPTTRVEKYING